jgi:nitroreductase
MSTATAKSDGPAAASDTSARIATGKEELSPIGRYREGMAWNAVEKVIMERRSIRSFKPEPLPDSMIRRILEAGRFAPSTANCQPWRFLVVKNPEILAAMERDAVRMIKLLMWMMDYTRGGWLRRLIALPIAKMSIHFRRHDLHATPFMAMSAIAQGKAPVFHGAPVIVLLAEDRRGAASPEVDIGICGQNMVLAAHSMGAGACWVGFVKLLMYMPWWRKRFGIKYPWALKECICFGWQRPKADGLVPREMQLVEWFEGGIDSPPRIERQGA